MVLEGGAAKRTITTADQEKGQVKAIKSIVRYTKNKKQTRKLLY